MDLARLTQLTAGYLDRSLAGEEMAELQRGLLSSPEARAGFWDAVEWHALFRQWGLQEPGREAAQRQPLPRVVRHTVPAPARKIIPFPIGRWMARIAAVLALTVSGWLAYPRLFPPGVAVLAQTSRAVWTGAGPRVGESLKPRTLRLRQGVAIFEFARGARVVLEGPAELVLVSENEGVLRSGRLRAHVPPSAHGFTIHTPQFAAVDLGTEFGCSVPTKGAAELHVFSGMVKLAALKPTEAVNASEAVATVHENQAVRIERGIARAIPARPEAFLGDDELARRALASRGDHSGAWHLATRALAAHPAALAHFDFERDTPMTNRARLAPANSLPILRGPVRTEGRWAGKGALDFSRAGDSVAFEVAGIHPALTVMAWVRIGDLQERRHLFASAEKLQKNEVQWYLNPNGTLAFSVHLPAPQDPARGWNYVVSQPVLQAHLNEWVHLASVADSTTGEVAHYLNGQPIGGGTFPSAAPFRPGACEIGNVLAPGGVRDPVRNFIGRMDEFTVLSTPLRAADVRHWYEAGAPPPGK